ncbi:hypothetical protein [Schumannella luteola]
MKFSGTRRSSHGALTLPRTARREVAQSGILALVGLALVVLRRRRTA